MVDMASAVDGVTEQTSDEKKKGRILAGILESAKKQRAEFIKTGREIERYGYSKDFEFEYTEFDGNLFFKSKVAKTAQFIDVVGPSLYPGNPDFRVNPRKYADPVSVQRSELMQEYLNYLPIETNMYDHVRRCVDDAMVYGRGVLWIGWNKKKNVPQAVMDTVDNLLVDPDATMWEDVKMLARKRCRPRWEWIKENPKKVKILKAMPQTTKRRSDGDSANMSWERQDYGTDMIVLYEVYMRVGIQRYRGGSQLDPTAAADADGEVSETEGKPFSDAPRKYLVSEDGKLIAEGDWEIPFYMDDAWPCEVLDFKPRPGCVWPVSPLESGLGHQRALNWIYTLYLSKARFTTRTLIAIMETNGQSLSEEMAVKALFGGSLEYLSIPTRGTDNPSIANFIQQMNFEVGVKEFKELSMIISHEFEMATGLTEFLMTGNNQKQPRSAEEVKLKDEKSRQRMDAMRDQTEKFMSKVGRRLAQAARYLVNPKQIAPVLGDEDAQKWGMVIPPIAVQAQKLLAEADSLGLSADEAEMFVADNISTDGVVFEQWITESDYTIAAGSMRTQNIDAQLDATEAASNQLLPVLLQQGAVGPAAAIMKAWATPRNLPPEVCAAIDQWAAAEQQKQQAKEAMEMQQMQLQLQQTQQQMQMQQQQMMMGGPAGIPPGQPAPGAPAPTPAGAGVF